MKIWAKNLAFVTEHNAKYDAGVESFFVEMNEFADLSQEEFAERYLIRFPEVMATTKCTGAQAPTTSLPESVDWVSKGAVTNIKNQGQCGSCWAFSATGSLEGSYFINKNQKITFSEQQLVDCSTSYGNHGCNGGLMNFSFFYVKDHGITTEAKYPYKGIGGSCRYKQETDQAWTISDCTEVTVDKEINLLGAIAKGPVSVAIQANQLSFQLYKGGVFSGICGHKLDHGVLAVGYGTDEKSSKKYYNVKNSWGAGWGDHGFIKIVREGDGHGKCGIQMAASYPLA